MPSIPPFLRLTPLIAAALLIPCTAQAAMIAQENSETNLNASVRASAESSEVRLPDAPEPQSTATASSQPGKQAAATPDGHTGAPKQTKRILFIVPNFRSVTADEKLPAMSVKDKFKLVLDDTFDYSGFIEVGILSGVSDWHKSEPEFGHGAIAYGRYYWHSFADATDGNVMTEFLVPVATHEDPRYYTLGHGGFLKRSVYSVSRLAITRSDSGHSTPNFSEIVGNGAASGISNFYYPGTDRTWTKTGQRWVLQVGIDGLANLAKEFWPEVNDKLFHDKY
jgi:hypothetical protein